MRFCILIFILFSFSISNPIFVSAQTAEKGIFQYDIEQGLPSSEVYDGFQDPLGYLWFTTDRGIVKFDGKTFHAIQSAEKSKTFSTCFRLVAFGNAVYTNSIDGKILKIQNNKATDFFKNNKSFKSTTSHSWYDILDIQDEDQSMVIVPNENAIPVKVSQNSTQPSPLPKIALDDSTFGFFGNTGTLLWRRLPIPDKYEDYISIKFQHRSETWAAFFPVSRYIYVFEGKKIVSKFKLGGKAQMHNVYVKDNLVYTCTNIGLIKSTQNGKIIDTTFNKFNISALISDYEGNLWICSLNKGIARVPATKISHILIDKQFHEKVLFLKRISAGLVAVTANNTVLLIDLNTKKILDIKHLDESRIPFDIVQNNDSLILLKHLLTVKNKRIIIHPIPTHFSLWNAVVPISNGRYVVSRHLGFQVLDRNLSTVLYNSAFNQKILCLNKTSENQILMGTVKGLYRFDIANKTLQLIKLPGIDSFIRVNNISLIDKYYLLATSGLGLVITDFRQAKIIGEIEGLPSSSIHKIITIKNNFAWISSNKGISELHFSLQPKGLPNLVSLINYSRNTGLSGSFVSDILLTENTIWIATNDGLDFFEIKTVNNKSILPKIFIESLNSLTSSLNISINSNNQKIELPYSENYFVINFNSIFFNQPINGSFYRYRFANNGIEEKWNYTDLNQLQFTNLNPGMYIFEVAARNNNHEWGPAAKLYIHITPHFSQTLWFKTILIILILGCIVGVLFIIYRRQQKIQQEKLQLQEARIRTREADLNTLRNQMNPHFVFNALNSIQGLIYNKDFKSANDYLVRFSQLMRDTLQISKTQAITIANEVQYLNNYLQIESSRFDNLFTYNITVDEELEIEHRGIPSMLVQPIVENAVKHAFKEKTETGLISIRFESHNDDNYMKVIIADNGIGIENARLRTPESKNRKSLGMQIVTERISLLQDKGYTLSKIAVQEEMINGMNTVITITLPFLEIE